jgi:DMSO reductase anchor subunit
LGVGCLAAVPELCLLCALLAAPLQPVACVVAALSVLAGAFVERWLFFAQARHLVTLYY